MMRRGLSKDEMDNMPITLFWALHIFDTYLEPQSPLFQDARHAQSMYYMHVTSPNMTREWLNKINVNQFRMIKDDKQFKTQEEIKEIARKKEEERNAALVDSFFDASLLQKLKSGQLG
ncbi:hypothetical protein DKN91_08930 [Escherichia coli]|jgi:hypothetical protein|nr:hypothetical protein [Escherichia coli]EFY0843092.1 hypothetical protein [Shigella sonnei]ELA6375288.1 hypothetical protein [Shigella flexneri]EZG32138.1 hypothetical protein AU10_09880 [Escherichia coli E1728]DAJ50552.1 MAG TPA: hypothetical protein [Caudoviricetes sp.]